jgi:hypothetical protein
MVQIESRGVQIHTCFLTLLMIPVQQQQQQQQQEQQQQQCDHV